MGPAKLYSAIVLLLAASCLLVSGDAALNGPCTVKSSESGASFPGVCIATEDCTKDGGTFKSTFCPKDPENIKCCYKSKCDGGGQCKFKDTCTTGKPTDSCPGPSDFMCCPAVSSATPPANSGNPPPTTKGKITVYWGVAKGSLTDACHSGNYDNIIISFLNVFGDGRPQQLTLRQCQDVDCNKLSSEIAECQKRNITVLLSIGGGIGTYSLRSDEDGKKVAGDLWNKYLGGGGVARPLGQAKLDGIDFDIESNRADANSKVGYAALAKELRRLMKTDSPKRYYITAAPQCPKPDRYLGPGEGTALGDAPEVFDWLNVQFYNNYCGYGGSHGGIGGEKGIIASWNAWSTWMAAANPAMRLYLGVPGIIHAAAPEDYMSPAVLATILPQLQQSSNYGGVMIWETGADNVNIGANGKPFSANIRSMV